MDVLPNWKIEDDLIADLAGDCPQGVYSIASVNPRHPKAAFFLRLFWAAPVLWWLVKHHDRYNRINARRDNGESTASHDREFVAAYEKRKLGISSIIQRAESIADVDQGRA